MRRDLKLWQANCGVLFGLPNRLEAEMKMLGRLTALLPLTMLLAGGVPRARAAKRPSLPGPVPFLIEAHLDKAEVELGMIMDSFEAGKAAQSQSALLRYSRHLSRVHVEIGRVDPKGNQRHFLPRIAGRLESHLSDLTSLLAETPSKLRTGLTQALGHVEGAVAMARRAAQDKSGRFELRISGYGDPPALPWRPNR